VRFVFYTDKTVAQCMSAINERLQTKSSRNLEGWVEKNGNFEISISSRVFAKFSHRTHLRGKVEREAGTSIVRGNVASGLERSQLLILGLLLLLACLAMIFSGQLLIGLALGFFGVLFYIPLMGDNNNSPLLISEIQRTLKAGAKSPKPTTPAAKAATPKRTPATSAKKPAAQPQRPNPTLFKD
jgi:hypothetical protein